MTQNFVSNANVA